ncbi:MAG: ABC transporter permease subunit [Candidatus Marinimicrobia bacterium]|nr:ABC transporter permease subunit [Candidatus Neomarinimicrobiota bacterium]
MSILTTVEAQSPKGRLFQAVVFLLLIAGGITMVYPFVLMVSGALRSEMDVASMTAVPEYLHEDTMLARKFLEAKYNFSVATMNRARLSQGYDFAQVAVPLPPDPARVAALTRFVAQVEIPDHWWTLGGTLLYRQGSTRTLRELQARIRARYDDDLGALAEDLGAPVRQWRLVQVMPPVWTDVRQAFSNSSLFQEYFALLREKPLAYRAFSTPTGNYLENIIYPNYGQSSVDAYNAAHRRALTSFADLHLPRTLPPPDQPRARQEWIDHARTMLHPAFIRVAQPAPVFQDFLRARHPTIAALNERWQTAYTDFTEIEMPGEKEWLAGGRRRDYDAFLATRPPEELYLVGPEYAWQDWLQAAYGSLTALNADFGTAYTDWAECPLPIDHAEAAFVLANRGVLRRELAANNFVNVLVAVLLEGRPFMNTVIYVVLALILALTLQPLAAYALSRFSPPHTWHIILLFMAVMSFPPMVGMIPQFLILRKLNLMNTFVALLLPVIVNGYLIFLLKGFFDSLPKHLYDAAMIDGASELRIFWEITMSMSKPILAVAALRVFNNVWMSFMYPLLVAPDEKMQILAVWLYQYQRLAGTPMVFASILITSIPTLVIFMFAQRIIMRGIAVPVEK